MPTGERFSVTAWATFIIARHCFLYLQYVILVTVSINLFSDGVQNYLDPSSRKLPSFKKYEKKHGIKKLSAVKANGEA